jgi:hypothetical protein
MHIYLGFVDHLIIKVYSECFLAIVHDGHSRGEHFSLNLQNL